VLRPSQQNAALLDWLVLTIYTRPQVACDVPPYTRDERGPAFVFLVVVLAELVYRHARKIAALLSRPELWPTILLFIPKINLISFGNETAGIRFDDVVLLSVAAFLLSGWVIKLDFTIDPVPATGLAVVAVFGVSNLLNAGHSNFLYSLRLVEYLIFYWSGKCFIQSRYDFSFLVKLLIVVNCAFILFQYAGIVGGFTADGYESALSRPFGLSANHPAEMGALLNILFAALAFGPTAATRFWYWCSFITLSIFITGSRSALFAHCLLTLVHVYRDSRNKTDFALRATAITGALIAVLALIPSSASTRSSDLLSWQNVEAIRTVYDNIPVEKEFTGFVEGGGSQEAPEDVDVSWYMRGFKWMHVVKIMFTASWTVWIFGLGPGALGPALDGGWLRLIGETGVVGMLAFITLLRRISGLNLSCSMAALALAVNMLMIDSQNAYKVMAFLFFLVGTQVQAALKKAHVAVAELPLDS